MTDMNKLLPALMGWALCVMCVAPTSTIARRMPDLDLVTQDGPLRVFSLLHEARPVLLNLGERGGFDITPWADRVQ